MRLLTDNEIVEIIGQGILHDADEEKVLSIGYDLKPRAYYNMNKEYYEIVSLDPGDSIFVECREAVSLPANMIVHIQLRNSRIRQGLTLDAPIYQPGHNTLLYYRITNVSKSVITLSTDDGTAYAQFFIIDSIPTKTYNGVFQNESDTFFGMSAYSDNYRKEISQVENFSLWVSA